MSPRKSASAARVPWQPGQGNPIICCQWQGPIPEHHSAKWSWPRQTSVHTVPIIPKRMAIPRQVEALACVSDEFGDESGADMVTRGVKLFYS